MAFLIRVAGSIRTDANGVKTITLEELYTTELDRKNCIDDPLWFAISIPEEVIPEREEYQTYADNVLTVRQLRDILAYLRGHFNVGKIQIDEQILGQ